MSRSSKFTDIPKPTDATFGERVGEAVSRLIGYRGDKDSRGERLDRALTPRDLMDDTFRSRFNVGNGSGSGTSVVVTPGPGGTPAEDDEPDLTPPPQPTGLIVTAGLANLIVEWDAALYPQGHGHGQTNLYVAKLIGSDPTQPTFVDAKLYASAGNALTIIALPADIGVRWHVWIKWQSKDGVESAAPAGGTNGVIAQAGKIGQHDLEPLLIEAGELATQDFGNLIGNPDGRFGASGWVSHDGMQPVADRNPVSIPFWGGSHLYFRGRDNVYGSGFIVKPGEQYRLEAELMPQFGAASPYDVGIGLYFFDTIANAEANVPMLATTPNALAALAPAATLGMRVLSGNVTIPAGAKYAKPWFVIGGPNTVANEHGFYGGKFVCRRRTDDTLIVNGAIQAYHMGVNSIAAGTLAVQAGAIVNFMLGTGSVDNAKVANLSADKLSVGTGTVGGILKSANFDPSGPNNNGWYLRPSDGYFEANNALLRGGIFASYGTIGGANINGAGVYSSNWTGPGGAGWYIENASGTIYANNLYARGDIQATSLEANTGHIGGANINAEGIYSSNWTGVGGAGWWLRNATGTIYANSLYARGDIEATSIKAGTANIVNTLLLQGESVTVMRGADAARFGAIACSITITPEDIPAGYGTVPVIVTGSDVTSAATYFDMGINQADYFEPGNQIGALNPGGVHSATIIHRAGVGTHVYSCFNHGAGAAGDQQTLYRTITAILGKR